MDLLKVIDILGIAAFSIAGAFAAIDKKLDLLGIYIIAFITALGGGTLRDILVGELPVKWMLDLSSGIVVAISTTAALLFTSVIQNNQKTLLFFDSIGLGFFTVLGVQTGISLGLNPAISILLGTITACFGGVIRDISLNTIPLIFHKEIYATTCILGGIIYLLLQNITMPSMLDEIICTATITLFRLLSVKYDWRLPVIWKPENS